MIKMIKVLSGDMDVDEVEKWLEEQGIREGDEVKVCELFDQYERRGEKRGIAMGERLGLEKGEKLGITKGENRFAKLVQMLMDGGRNEDVRRVAVDPAYREQLYMEANLV